MLCLYECCMVHEKQSTELKQHKQNEWVPVGESTTVAAK